MNIQDSPAQSRISYSMLLCIVGWSLLQASTAAVIFSPAVQLGEANDAVSIGIDRGLLLLAIALTYVTDFLFRVERKGNAAERVLSGLLFVQLPLLALFDSQGAIAVSYPVARISWILCGIGIGIGNGSWIKSHIALDADEFNHTSHWSITVFTVSLTAILLIPIPYILGVICVIFLLGTFLPALTADGSNKSVANDSTQKIEFKPSHTDKYIIRNGSFLQFVNGSAEGMIAGLIVYRAASGTIHPALIGVCVVISATIYIVLRRVEPGLLAPERSQLLFHPVVIVALVCVGFVSRPYNVIPAIIAFALFYLFDRVNYLRLTIRGFLLEGNPVFFYERRRVWIICGLALGWFVGAFVASDVGHGTFSIFALCIIALLCFHFSIIAIKPSWSPIVVEHVRRNESEKIESWAETNSGDIPSKEADQPSDHYVTGHFQQKCMVVAKNASLTPRESEVLCFLAKGRNAQYIASQLYISKRTVKTHGYHIYQKLGIHSQQELIDLVEAAEV